MTLPDVPARRSALLRCSRRRGVQDLPVFDSDPLGLMHGRCVRARMRC